MRRSGRTGSQFWRKLIVIALILAFAAGHTVPVEAAVTPTKVTGKVKSEVNKYPFSSGNEVKSRSRRNPKVLGVKTSLLKSYKAYMKSSDDCEYLLFVGRAKSSKKAATAKKALNTFINSEKESMNNYLSPDGKTAFGNVKVGKSGKWVWAVMLTSKSDNKKAVSAIKKAIK